MILSFAIFLISVESLYKSLNALTNYFLNFDFHNFYYLLTYLKLSLFLSLEYISRLLYYFDLSWTTALLPTKYFVHASRGGALMKLNSSLDLILSSMIFLLSISFWCVLIDPLCYVGLRHWFFKDTRLFFFLFYSVIVIGVILNFDSVLFFIEDRVSKRVDWLFWMTLTLLWRVSISFSLLCISLLSFLFIFYIYSSFPQLSFQYFSP